MADLGTDLESNILACVKPILSYIRASVGRTEDAEDLAQDVIMQALSHRAQFRGGDLNAWVYQIARNRVIAYYRKCSVMERARQTLMDDPTPNATSGTDDPIVHAENRLAMADAVAELPELEREALRLKFGLAADNRWIAGELGISPGYLGVILHRALRKLRARLEQVEEGLS